MTTEPHIPTLRKASSALRSAEWLAENAYIAPGFHRLLTAGGLTLGLWGGRKLMDVIVARNTGSQQETETSQVLEILHPLHGALRYNPYSDAPADRWKFVADRFAPLLFGAVGAYLGGRVFFHGTYLSGKPFSPASAAAKTAWQEGRRATDTLDTLLGLAHADATRKWAAATFVEGSAAGMHLPGALWPFNNGMIAVSFQQGARRSISFPWARPLNRWLGNYGASSRYLYAAQRDTVKWIEANVMRFEDASQWATPEALLRRARDGLQKFPQRSAADEQKLAEALHGIIRDAYHHKASLRSSMHGATPDAISAEIYRFVSGAHPSRRRHGLVGSAYDHLLHGLGFSLKDMRLSRDPWAFFSRLFGSGKEERALLHTYGTYLKQHFHPELNVEQWVDAQVGHAPWKTLSAYAAGVGAVGGGLWGAHAIHRHHQHALPNNPPLATASKPSLDQSNQHWINGKPLDAAHWLARVVITPPSMHRFMNAAYLSLMLYGGMRLTNILTGRKLASIMSGVAKDGIAESLLPRGNVLAPLRPLHGLLAYTPGSASLRDRWRQALHFILPAGVGMFGTYGGSMLYFREREKTLANPHSLEDYADRISFEQSKVYAGATALTSILNTGSGIHLLPIFNYSSNLHNRYLMGAGQQVAMPGIGKWWSGNAGTTPWGVKQTLRYLSQYLTQNPVARPQEVPALLASVVGKLYPTLTPSQRRQHAQRMMDTLYAARDPFLTASKVTDETQRPALQRTMSRILQGEGFEQLLLQSGLNPARADLAANGASGKIANALGKRSKVMELQREYRQQFAARMAIPAPDLAAPHEAPASFRARLAAEKSHPEALSLSA